VHARQAGDKALDRVVRAGYPDQQVGYRQADRDQYPVQDVEGQHAGAGGQGDRELGPAEGEQPSESRNVDEPDSRVDDDRAERGRREARQHRPREEQDGEH
jgi:hypothetical protein